MPLNTHDACPCGNPNTSYGECCAPIHAGTKPATTAEQLMRARYSAHASADIDFLMKSWWPESRSGIDSRDVRQWAESNRWLKLTIHQCKEGAAEDIQGWVEFTALYQSKDNNNLQAHREKSFFRQSNGQWYFVDGEAIEATPKVGRNDPCPCGSQRKFKRCCG